MREPSIGFAACACAAMLVSCGGSGSGGFTARPGESVTVTHPAGPSGSLSDLASQVTTDTLLRRKGARLLRAVPFAPCPGEAGEQTFSVPSGHGADVLHVAFTQWNGKTTIASYERPANASDDPSAVDALRKAVCSNAL